MITMMHVVEHLQKLELSPCFLCLSVPDLSLSSTREPHSFLANGVSIGFSGLSREKWAG